MKCQILLFLSFLFLSCSQDEELLTSSAFVDDELQAYFETFVLEGLARGMDINFNQVEIEGYIDNTDTRSVIGQCYHNSDDPNKIVINRIYWRTSTDLEKEVIVFHELGHCYLQRSHLDESNAAGDCLSLMHSSNTVCNLEYNALTREGYLDELYIQ